MEEVYLQITGVEQDMNRDVQFLESVTRVLTSGIYNITISSMKTTSIVLPDGYSGGSKRVLGFKGIVLWLLQSMG